MSIWDLPQHEVKRFIRKNARALAFDAMHHLPKDATQAQYEAYYIKRIPELIGSGALHIGRDLLHDVAQWFD